MKALLPSSLLLAAALLISPWATASRQPADLAAPASVPSSSLQVLLGKTVVVRYLNYTSAAYDNDQSGTLVSADDTGLLLQVENFRKFVPMHAIRFVSEEK